MTECRLVVYKKGTGTVYIASRVIQLKNTTEPNKWLAEQLAKPDSEVYAVYLWLSGVWCKEGANDIQMTVFTNKQYMNRFNILNRCTAEALNDGLVTTYSGVDTVVNLLTDQFKTKQKTM